MNTPGAIILLNGDEVLLTLENQVFLIFCPAPRPYNMAGGVFSPSVPEQARVLISVDPVEHGWISVYGGD